LVDDRQGHGQPGRRAADVARVEPDLYGRPVTTGETHADEPVTRHRDDRHLHVLLGSVAGDAQHDRRPRFVRLHDLRQVVGLRQPVPVGSDDLVAGSQHVVRGEGDALHDAGRGLVRVGAGQADDVEPGYHRDLVSQRAECGDARGVLRLGHVAHGLQVGEALRSDTGDVFLLHDVDVGVELGLQQAPQVHVRALAYEQQEQRAATVSYGTRMNVPNNATTTSTTPAPTTHLTHRAMVREVGAPESPLSGG